MRNSETFALDQWLDEYPENMTYEEILDLLRKNADKQWDIDEIIAKGYLYHYRRNEIADFIEDTRKEFEKMANNSVSTWHRSNAIKIDAIYDEDRFLKLESDSLTARELSGELKRAYAGRDMPELIDKIVFWIDEHLEEPTP